MRHYIYSGMIISCLMILMPTQARAALPRDLFASDMEMDEISKGKKTVVFTDESYRDISGSTVDIPSGGEISFEYLGNRRALTGRDCNINKIINTVDVGSGQMDLDNVLNDDLNDYGEFISTVKVGVAYNPLLSIKDNSCYYAKGTTAGYCVVSGSGNTVLSLDVIKVMAISFYRDGKLIETVDIQEGQDGSGVNLKLVNIPGSDQAGMCLSAVAPCVFDEISLDFSGGANVGVGQVYRIKYAFVGDAREFTITQNPANGSVIAPGMSSTPYQQYDPEHNSGVDLDYVKGWNPVLLGIPFPLLDSELAKMTNADYDDYAALTPIVGAVYMGGAKFMMQDKYDKKREVYQSGTEVGFSYKYGSGLSIDLGNTIQIILFDRDGNQVQTETIGAGVLGLSVAKGGDGSACITSTVPFSGAELRFYGALEVNLGALGIHYAFIREQPEVRHTCPINPSASVSLCAEQDSYQLLSNPAISVTWSLDAFYPAADGETTSVTVSPGGLVKGLDTSGDYVFRATAADGCSEIMTISFDKFPDPREIQTQGNPLVNDYNNGKYEVSTYYKEQTSGGLIIIDGAKDSPNVIDGSYNEATDESGLNKYATWGGIELASNQMIIGVKRTDGLIVDYDRDHGLPLYENGTRVGFVVASSVTGLNVSALNFWNIRCFHQGQEVYRHVIDESNAVSAALAGTDGGKRTRYTITIPWYDKNGNHIKVDEIQMWSSGLLDLRGEQLDIYYGFVEGEGEDGGNPLNCSATVISASTTGASIDNNMLCNASLVQALGAMDNISYIIDDDPDMETALIENHTAGVAARVTIPVKLGRTLDFRHEIGVVMRNDAYLADVKLGSGMVIYTMYQGQKTGDEFTQWGVLGADVAGFGDKQIFYIHPKRLFDEVVIDYGDGVTIASPQFFGLFMRTDADGDGIPDCQDPSSCTSTVKDIDPDDVCQGSEIYISATGIPGYSYTVEFTDPAALKAYGDKYAVINTTNESSNNLTIQYTTENAGQYHMVFYNGAAVKDDDSGDWDISDLSPIASAVYYVHPNYTEWRADAAGPDWNNWNNWTAGTPYCCTDVLIPDGAKTYPSLSGLNENGDEFCCNKIFMRPGAYIGGINKLNYTKAWVQMELSANCYNLLSAPLSGMVSGDMFIPAYYRGIHNPEPFVDLIPTGADNDPEKENRFDPTIYQRMWYNSAIERNLGDTPVSLPANTDIEGINVAKWSSDFNHLNTPYTSGMGFSLWVDNGALSPDGMFRFTFPKEHTEYSYFDDYTRQPIPNVKETTLQRGEEHVPGRFIYERNVTSRALKYGDENRDVFDLADGLSASISAEETTGYFLLGNPFMSPVNSRRLIKGNSDIIRGIISFDGSVTSSLVYDDTKDEFIETGAVEEIAPMTAVFVIAKENSKSLDVRLTEDMILPEFANEDEYYHAKGIRIQASSGNYSTSMFALEESDIMNHALIDNEVAPQLAIFATFNGEACDIAPIEDVMPLTIITDSDRETRLDFLTNDVNRDEWKLIDNASGTEYPLDREVILPSGTSSGRFCLSRKSDFTTGIDNNSLIKGNVYICVENNKIRAHSPERNLVSMEIYDLSGAMISKCLAPNDTDLIETSVKKGVYVICVSTKDKSYSYKILVR